MNTTFLNAVDSENRTALFRASVVGDSQIVDLLLQCGADPALRPKLNPRLVLLHGSGLEKNDKGMLVSKMIKDGCNFDEDALSFLAGVPSTAASVASTIEGPLYFELEVGERYVGMHSRLVVGLTADKNRYNTFKNNLGNLVNAGTCEKVSKYRCIIFFST